MNVMPLNHPETIPLTPVHVKIVSHETDPWYQKPGDCWYVWCYKNILLHVSSYNRLLIFPKIYTLETYVNDNSYLMFST